jgi:UPF0755 protein
MSLSEVLPGFSPEQPPPRRRGAVREQRKRKRRRRRRGILAIFLTFAVVTGGIAGAWFGLAPLVRQLNEPNDFTGAGTGQVQVKIPIGASGRTIARVLTASGVTKTEAAFLDAAKNDPRSTGIQPGTYELHKTMSAASALALLLDPKSRLTRSVTITEGTRAADVYTILAKKLTLRRADLVKASTSEDIGLPAAARGRPEGFLFPATYVFPPDVTATEALTEMVNRGKQAFTDLDIPASQLRDVVIKASIVQAEARQKKDMSKIARVIDNRLARKMNLQLDSTVSYATNHFAVTTTAAQRRTTSRYNTYRYAGLPAGPIGNPGEEALKAVLDPAPGSWLFFVAVNPDTGVTKFAQTQAEHDAYVKEFQAWLRTH